MCYLQSSPKQGHTKNFSSAVRIRNQTGIHNAVQRWATRVLKPRTTFNKLMEWPKCGQSQEHSHLPVKPNGGGGVRCGLGLTLCFWIRLNNHQWWWRSWWLASEWFQTSKKCLTKYGEMHPIWSGGTSSWSKTRAKTHWIYQGGKVAGFRLDLSIIRP